MGMTHLAEVGPLGVAVYASGWGGYSSGVYSGCAYDSNIALNHAVQLVGYGTDPAEGDYWIVRNRWGTGWGEGGYIRLARDAEAQCGTDSTPMDGTACVVSSLTSLGLLAPTTLPCLEHLINKTLTFPK